MSLKNTVIASVILLTLLSLTFFIHHEYRTLTNAPKQIGETKVAVRNSVNLKGPSFELLKTNVKFIADHISPDREVDASMLQRNVSPQKAPEPIQNYPAQSKGKLVCNGQSTDSEMAYWKKVAGDENFESPFTPHHKNHNDRYLSFEYDHGGWNNGRLGYEALVVLAHAMGRTLVVPPQQHLYLMALNHKDKDDQKEHDEMGFLDFYDINLMRTQKGFHVMEMPEFLAKEGVTGGLHNRLPPGNSTQAWGKELWKYLAEVADETPAWFGKFMMFPSEPGDLDMVKSLQNERVLQRLRIFSGERFNNSAKQMTYNRRLQEAHHIHIRGDDAYRILQHHYAFAFFADPAVQSFYKRFVRDYMRYKDEIQCAAKEVVDMIREDAKKLAPHDEGNFYTLHIRRGDFQFKWVKHGAEKILSNLRFPNGTSIIPPGSMVYIATDDPDGVCFQCLVEKKSCNSYEKGKKPVGCPEDPSWDAFLSFGWKLRFLRDYLPRAVANGSLKTLNPNAYGMLECLICSRGVVFAGTYMSTFTGYIHRVRGYHGLGEDTYYHTSGHIFMLQQKEKGGHGWTREFRTGWTDDGGDLI